MSVDVPHSATGPSGMPPLPPRGYYVPQPPPRSRGGLWFLIFILAGLLTLSLLAHMGSWVDGAADGASLSGLNLEEQVLEASSAAEKILVIDITGIISSLTVDRSGAGMVDWVDEQLDRAALDGQIRAVLLKVDSPGGEVLASDRIYERIRAFQESTGKPVVASMGGLAASGGYYVSAPCRWIVAHPLTITGSIGVIMHGYHYRDLMDKVGVRPNVFKSGRYKDMLSGEKRMEDISAEERQLVQDMVDQTFDRFKEVIREGRSWAAAQDGDPVRALSAQWEDYADGRILSGDQAMELGMVDELGDLDVAFARAKSLTGLADAKLVTYEQPFSLASFFRIQSRLKPSQQIKLDLGIQLPQLEAGRLYFLSSNFIQ
jgi:protease-4